MHRICRLEEIVPGTGVCALVGGEQVAVFRVEENVYAVGNGDPFSGANVLSRGIVGDIKGELVVASPVYKQHFSLVSGRCIEDSSVRIPVYAAKVDAGFVFVEPRHEIATTCCYCGIGCGVLACVSNNEIISVKGDPAHPANFGRLCTKGLSLHKADPSFRALYPEVCGERRSWDDALDFIADIFSRTISLDGPDAVAFYISGQFLTEDYYVFNKLAKGLIGTNNIDTNSRLCMASAVAGYKQTLGADAPPACYEDIESADCIFIAGSNAAWAHPVLFRRIEKAAPKNLVVVDPRKTETARAATLHLQIAPGTDVALFNGMLHVMLREGWVDREYMRLHTEGFEGLRDTVRDFTPLVTASLCALTEQDVVEAARLFATSRATLSLYCQGLNQSSSGTAKNAALINLHLATGHIGKPGAGPFSLTGQPNAMGGREVGGMANLLSGHRDLSNENHRKEVADLWGVKSIPEKPGKTAVEMFEAVRAGEIKVLWIACTNPAQSLPDQKLVHEALERAELVIVQDAYRHTETAAYADVFLPAAGWGEKEGTMTNSERRISRVRAAVPPPGEARQDWRIAVDFSRKLFPGKFNYESPEDIFNEHRETTRGRDLDITGLSYALLDELGPQQWPFPEGARQGRKRLYEDGVFPTASGRARFVSTPYRPVAEDVDARYPLRLTTGRLRDQWHTMSRTGTIAGLFAHEPEARLTAHPDDLSRLGLKEGELVKVSSRRGQIYLPAAPDQDLPRGVVFVPMHWGARFLGGKGRRGVNELTLGALDPSSRQPELKHCAVRVEAAELPWRLVAFGHSPDVSSLMSRLDPMMGATPYAARTLIGRERPGVRLSLAAKQAPGDDLLRRIEAAFGDGGTVLKDCGLLAPGGRTVCNCFDVAERDIEAFLAASKSLAELQASLKCGTNCGSCLPELRRMAAAA
ncbi:MAG TPA: nitrite reductase small subunit NirD [Burkholderiales bacterium]|nr:nitrite reductase small subunit NirD [Burkholderiales bacterium]